VFGNFDNSISIMRLAVWTILNGAFGKCFVLLAMVCTSFSAINQGTAKRSPTTPWGNTALPHVQDCRLHDQMLEVFDETTFGETSAE